MLQIAKYLHNKFWLLVAWTIILLAILLTLLRLLLPRLDLTEYRHDIEQVVEERVGLPLHLGAMQAEMLDARLALKFVNVSLLDPETQAPRVHFREAHIQINLLHSLFSGGLVLGKVMLVGGRLNLLRDPDGVFSINGFRASGGQNVFAGPLLSRLQLSVRDSEVHWQDQLTGATPVHLYRVDASLSNSGRRHQLAAVAHVGLLGAERLRVMADLREGTEDPLAVAGRVYLQSAGFELGGRLAADLPGGVKVDQAKVDLELWGELRAGRIQHLQGNGEINNLMLSAAQSPALQLDRIAALFDWRAGPHGWQLDLDRLVMMSNSQLWPPGRLSMAWQSKQTGEVALQVGVDYLRLKEATQFAALLPSVGEEVRQALLGLAPTGHLSRFRLALDQSPAQPTRWRVSGSVSDYSHRPWKSAPGLAGLNLSFAGNQDGGGLHLASKAFMADIPKLFREPLSANQLQGNFKWNLHPQSGLHLKTHNLSIVTDHLQTFSRMELQLPMDGENPFLDMQTDFWNGDGAHKSRYLPAGIMPKPLVDWLDSALVSGHVKSGSMLLYGPLKAFPFRHHEGRFEVLFGIENMVLDYKPDWPRLEEVVAEAHFLNNSLEIELLEGIILESRLQRCEARIRQLKGSSPVEISGSVEGPFSDLFRVLNETPLQRQFGKFTTATAGSGQVRTWLDLQIPLKKADTWQIHGKIDFQQAALRLKEYDLALQGLAGQLQFDEKQVWGQDIKGRLLDQPVMLQIEPQERNGQRVTRVKSALNVDAAWLRQRFPGLLDVLDGTAHANLQLAIAHGNGQTPVSLSVYSGLRGMAVNLPEPLGKSRQTTRQLDLRLDFLDAQQRDLRITYGGFVRAWLRKEGESFRQGDIRFGGGSAELPSAAMFRVRGNMDRLDLDRWVGWLGESAQASAKQEAVPLQMDLQVHELKLVGMVRPDVSFQIEPIATGWQANFASDDLNGTLNLPRDPERIPLAGHLKQLRLKSTELVPAEQPGEQAAPGTALDLDPHRLPGLDLTVDSLWVDDKSYGKAILQWARSPLGIQVNKLEIQGTKLDLHGSGYWQKIGERHLTQLELQGHVKSLGQLQEDLGLQLGIAKAPLDFTGTFSWPLAPYALKLNQLSGKFELHVGAGEITDVEPGVGRLVGLLSLHALGKRLSLDFSDLFAKGLEFDRIEGNFVLADGNAETNNLLMVSPAAQILIVGRTGLAARDYDQHVTVVPRVSSTLPLLGAIAISPAVGVVLVVTQELFGKQVDRIIQSQYHLTGSWDAPKIIIPARDTREQNKSGMMPDLPAN